MPSPLIATEGPIGLTTDGLLVDLYEAVSAKFSASKVSCRDTASGHQQVVLVHESDVAEDGTWSLSGLPQVFTVTLLEVETVVGNTVQPELLVPSMVATDGSLCSVYNHPSAAQKASEDKDIRITSPSGVLYGRSHAAGGAVRVVTRITLLDGHR